MGGGGGSTSSHTYYYYKFKFPHNSIDPSQPILMYDAYSVLIRTVPPYYSGMNYGIGVLSVPGNEQDTVTESVSTATYYVLYGSEDLIIDYENAKFKISKNILRSPAQSTIRATFEYLTVFTPLKDIASIIDGKWDTQVQTVFYSEPIKEYRYGIIDLGQEYEMQAFDIIGGFYRPDSQRKYDTTCNLSLKYSTDGINYYYIGEKTTNFQLDSGTSVSFEEKDLGAGFSARYMMIVIEKIKKIEVTKNGLWVLAITEVSAYNDIIVKSECKLIPLAYTTSEVSEVSTTINVDNTAGFDTGSVEIPVTAYFINEDGSYNYFTYEGKTSTSFTGVEWESGEVNTFAIDSTIVKELEGDNTLYDHFQILPKLGDRFFSKDKSDDDTLFSQSQMDYLSKAYLQEFVKNHSKVQLDVIYSPHLMVGQTIRVIDTVGGVDQNYFIDSISDVLGKCTLTLARYPA